MRVFCRPPSWFRSQARHRSREGLSSPSRYSVASASSIGAARLGAFAASASAAVSASPPCGQAAVHCGAGFSGARATFAGSGVSVAAISHEILVSLPTFRDVSEMRENLVRQAHLTFLDYGYGGFRGCISQVRDCPAVPRPARMVLRFRRKHHSCDRVTQTHPAVKPRIG